MDDLEFRRRALADPSSQHDDFLQQQKNNPEHQRLVQELQTLDQQIHAALKVPVPEGLAERILLRQSLHHKKQQQRQRIFYAMAASMLLGLLALFTHFKTPTPDDRLQAAVLEHVYSELDHLAEQQNKNTSDANQLLASFGGHLSDAPGKLNYLGQCDIHQHQGIHMILPGKHGKITVLVLPEQQITKTQIFSDARFQGRLIPTARGSIAIVGERGEDLHDTQQQLQQTLHWQTPEPRNT